MSRIFFQQPLLHLVQERRRVLLPPQPAESVVHVAQIHVEMLLEQRSQLADLGVALVHASRHVYAIDEQYGGNLRVRPAVFLLRHGFRLRPLRRTLHPAAQVYQQHLHRDQPCRQYVVARGELRLLVQHEAAALGA